MNDNRIAAFRVSGRAVGLVALCVALPFLVSACASDGDVDLASYVETIEPADALYNQALANLEAGRLSEAAKKFESVDRQHPYTDHARRSLVMGAFTNYRLGNYEDAVTQARRYVALYPTSEDAAYAQYIIGLSNFRQIQDVTRDQKESRVVVQTMQELIDRWPDSEYVPDARVKIRFARDQLAGKEMQIGRYYLERREYIAAVRRFRNVVETYSDTNHVEESLARLTEAYYSMGLASEAQTAAAVLGHNYPESQWYKDSYALLQSGGLEPRENKGSWLSQVGTLITGS